MYVIAITLLLPCQRKRLLNQTLQIGQPNIYIDNNCYNCDNKMFVSVVFLMVSVTVITFYMPIEFSKHKCRN